jgi:hypothetical protein
VSVIIANADGFSVSHLRLRSGCLSLRHRLDSHRFYHVKIQANRHPPQDTRPIVFETRGARKTYVGKIVVPVLHGITLQIWAGEFVSIMGQVQQRQVDAA